jgi:hypothetical protein
VTGTGEALFSRIMQPTVLQLAQSAAEFGLPSVLAIAIELADGQDPLSPFERQFCGAVVCVLMEANGYQKTGKKRSVPHRLFTTGEVYTRSV